MAAWRRLRPAGNNTIFGGSGADTITVGDGNNTIFGDNGVASFAAVLVGGAVAANDATYASVLTSAATTAEAKIGGTTIETTNAALGGTVYSGSNTIQVGNGNNTIVGGLGQNTITAGVGNNVIVGGSGSTSFQVSGSASVITSVSSAFGNAPPPIGSSTNATITVGSPTSGVDVIIGGPGANAITLGATGAYDVVGADGQASFTNGVLTAIQSIDPTDYGNDVITGPSGTPAGSGGSTIIGGSGSNTITVGGSNNTIIGADGQANFTPTGRILSAQSIDPANAGADVITVTSGGNLIIGGSGSNTITLGSGSDWVVGADGEGTFTNGALSALEFDRSGQCREQHHRRTERNAGRYWRKHDHRRLGVEHDQRRRRRQHDHRRGRRGAVQRKSTSDR